MSARQSLVLVFLFALLAAVAAWLQLGVLGQKAAHTNLINSTNATEQANYTIENFTSTGRDNTGKKFQVRAARLTNYASAHDSATLTRPHITQYDSNTITRQIRADGGVWLADEILLEGNVKVVERGGDFDAATAVKKMRIRLDSGAVTGGN